MQHAVSFSGQPGSHLPSATPLQTRVSLLEYTRPWPLAGREIEIPRESFAVSHRHHHAGLGHVAEIEIVGGRKARGRKEGRNQAHKQQDISEHGHDSASRFHFSPVTAGVHTPSIRAALL